MRDDSRKNERKRDPDLSYLFTMGCRKKKKKRAFFREGKRKRERK